MKTFGDLSWAAGIDEVKLVSAGVGQIRQIRLAGRGDWFDERLLSFDERNMTLSYSMDDGAMGGLINYRAQSQVLNRATGCLVRWQCQADAETEQYVEVQALLDQFAEGIAGLFAAQFETDRAEAGHVPA